MHIIKTGTHTFTRCNYNDQLEKYEKKEIYALLVRIPQCSLNYIVFSFVRTWRSFSVCTNMNIKLNGIRVWIKFFSFSSNIYFILYVRIDENRLNIFYIYINTVCTYISAFLYDILMKNVDLITQMISRMYIIFKYTCNYYYARIHASFFFLIKLTV